MSSQSRWPSLRPCPDDPALPLAATPTLPAHWLEHVNGVETARELAALRRAVRRNWPFGSESWQRATGQRLGLQSTLKPLGRPQKGKGTRATAPTLFDALTHPNDAP